MRKNSVFIAILIAVAGFCWFVAANASQSKVQSRAYVGHENDRDIRNFVSRYPKTVGTRLDDCQTCHRSGVSGTDTEREYSPCGYCHLLQYPNPRYKTGVPQNFENTLNAYGLAYKKQGRSVEALSAIAKLDSDGDGYSNAQEIAGLRYPGDKASRPGQPMAPIVTLGWTDIHRLPPYSQFMLMNTTSEPFDDYTTYAGVKVQDLLKAAHIDLKGATGITVFAPDGYNTDFTIEDVTGPFPKSVFYAAPGAIQDKEKALARYPETIPAGVVDGKEMPMIPWLLLAFERDGKPLDIAQYEKGTGRLAGEGPYRLVKPQRSMAGDASRPGRPDRSVKSKVFGDGWDFDKALDHNAGSCVRGATVIRINPMPAGIEEYDWKNGWPLVSEKKIVIFGHGVQKK
ncbi:MAG TPA: GEGP motif-containing diheme protein [Acidobacteriota bacterium]|nr:GEGP motif-containing diheme protein [Acidobacteriota bacterium]